MYNAEEKKISGYVFFFSKGLTRQSIPKVSQGVYMPKFFTLTLKIPLVSQPQNQEFHCHAVMNVISGHSRDWSSPSSSSEHSVIKS